MCRTSELNSSGSRDDLNFETTGRVGSAGHGSFLAEAVVIVGPVRDGSVGSRTVGVGKSTEKREVIKSTTLGVARDVSLVGLALGGGVVSRFTPCRMNSPKD